MRHRSPKGRSWTVPPPPNCSATAAARLCACLRNTASKVPTKCSSPRSATRSCSRPSRRPGTTSSTRSPRARKASSASVRTGCRRSGGCSGEALYARHGHIELRHSRASGVGAIAVPRAGRSEEHTSELQSRRDLVCRLLLEKKKKKIYTNFIYKKKKNKKTKK